LKIQTPKSFLPYLCCIGMILVWFCPWWAGGKVLAPLDLQNRMMSPWRADSPTEFAKNHVVADGVDQYLVYRMIAERDFRREGWVGWSSLTYGGTAQYANTMALYYDWTMQLHRWFDFWTAWHLGIMMQAILAAAGMLLFLRGRGVSALWSVCGALAYAANSQFVTWIYHRWALGAFCWLPWVLWAIDLHRKGNRFAWGFVPCFIAMAFLGGTLQHAALAVLAVAAMWLEEALQSRTEASLYERRCSPGSGVSDIHGPPLKFGLLRMQSRILGRYAAWGLLGTGLAGMMLVPCIDAFVTSNRLGLHTGMTANATNSIYPQGPLQALFNLAAYPFQVFPSLLGRCDSVDVLKLFKSELFYIFYFGSLPVLVAFLALWRKDSPLLSRILIGCGLLLPLTPLVRLLYQRLFLLFILGGILAFAHFMEHASRQTRLKVFRITGSLAAIGVVAWTGLSVRLHFKPGLIDPLREKIITEGRGSSFGYFSEWIAQRADRFLTDLSIWSPQQFFPLLLLIIALAGLRMTAAKGGAFRQSGSWMVVIVVIAETCLFGSRWIVWSDTAKDPLFAQTSESRVLQEKVGQAGRVTTLIHSASHMARTPFIPNTLAPYGISTISGYDSIVPDGMLLPNESSGDAVKLGRLGVGHLITWSGNPDVPVGWNPIWNGRLMDLYKNSSTMPRYAGFLNDEDQKFFLNGGMPEVIPIQELSNLENSRKFVIPNFVRWVRIAENQANGWVFRSSASTPWQDVQRASDSSMLIRVPQTSTATTIEMKYAPPLRVWGFYVSGGALFATLAGTMWIISRTKNPTVHEAI
jgi:hypothetical protein